MKWSPQQKDALDAVAYWHHNWRSLGKQVFRVFGYAGTGKTTLARHFADQIGGLTCYGAFTGKAALMMRRNGCRDASTIHSLIYTVKERADGSTRFVFNKDSEAAEADLIVIDECSMVDEEIGTDLLRYGVPILVLGDPAQLPPVRGAGFFTDADPDVMLTEIHRQAAENPIIQMATTVRQGGKLAPGDYGSSRVIARGILSGREVLATDQVLVGTNQTRNQYNRKIRRLLGRHDHAPQAGDRLVCLRNDKTLKIFNGGMFTVTETDGLRDDLYHLWVASEDFPERAPFMVQVRREHFDGGLEALDWRDKRGTQEFDYGYALTTHKAQGSQWGEVIIYDESRVFRDEWQRWLYTALTRASETVTVVA